MAGPRPSLTLSLDPGSTPYNNPPNAARSPEDHYRVAAAPAAQRTFLTSPELAQSQSPSGNGRGLPITPRSISRIVSLNDLRQLMRRMEEAPPPSASPPPDRALPVRNADDEGDDDEVLVGNGSGSGSESGNGNKDGGAGAGEGRNDDGAVADARGGWSDGVLEVVSVLGEGASGTVQAVRDTRTERRYARKTIATHEGPLKQLVRELAFLAGLRHAHIVRFHGAYMNSSNTEVKLVMELCEGRSLAAVGEQIRRRKGRVGEKVARVLAEGVCASFLSQKF
jgi:Protein kinase domain